MNTDVLCLRPEADFTRVDAPAPPTLRVTYRKPDDADVPALMRCRSPALASTASIAMHSSGWVFRLRMWPAAAMAQSPNMW